MSRLIRECYYYISDRPAFPGDFQNISTYYHSTAMPNFNVKICVRFMKNCSSCGVIHFINNIPATPVSSHCISCSEFFQKGSSFLHRYLSHHLIEPEMLDFLIPKLVDEAREFFHNDSSHPVIFEDRLAVFPLCINLLFEFHEDVDLEHVVADNDDVDEQIRMIPTCEETIQSLNKTKFQEEDIDSNEEKNGCCICVEDFRDGVEVSRMPCQHVFHYDCIVSWLKTSHLCPLCRYPMPKLDDNNLEIM